MDEQLDEVVEDPSGAGEASQEESETLSSETAPEKDAKDTVDFFNEGDEEEEAVEGEKPEKKEARKEEIDPEAEEIEKQLKVGSTNFADLKKEYPELLKKFPSLRDDLFAVKAYRQIHGTVEEAKEAAQKAEVFDALDEAVVSGKTDFLLGSMNDGSLKLLAKNFLPSLHRKSPDLFVEATTPLLRHVLRGALKKAASFGADSKEGKNLAAAARVIHNHIFDSYDIPEHDRKSDPEADSRVQELTRQRQADMQSRAGEFNETVFNQVNTNLRRFVEDGLDPDGKMSSFLKKSIVDSVIAEIGEKLDDDETHMSNMRAMLRKAAKGNFPRAAVSQIVSAYLGRARNMIGPIRSRLRSEALGENNGKGKANVEKSLTPKGGVGGGKVERIDSKRLHPSVSTKDIFDGNVRYRK